MTEAHKDSCQTQIDKELVQHPNGPMLICLEKYIKESIEKELNSKLVLNQMAQSGVTGTISGNLNITITHQGVSDSDNKIEVKLFKSKSSYESPQNVAANIDYITKLLEEYGKFLVDFDFNSLKEEDFDLIKTFAENQDTAYNGNKQVTYSQPFSAATLDSFTDDILEIILGVKAMKEKTVDQVDPEIMNSYMHDAWALARLVRFSKIGLIPFNEACELNGNKTNSPIEPEHNKFPLDVMVRFNKYQGVAQLQLRRLTQFLPYNGLPETERALDTTPRETFENLYKVTDSKDKMTQLYNKFFQIANAPSGGKTKNKSTTSSFTKVSTTTFKGKKVCTYVKDNSKSKKQFIKYKGEFVPLKEARKRYE